MGRGLGPHLTFLHGPQGMGEVLLGQSLYRVPRQAQHIWALIGDNVGNSPRHWKTFSN